MKLSHWLKVFIHPIRFTGWTGSLKSRPQRALFVIWAVTAAVPTLRAQIVNDGASATLANVTNTLTGTVTVGTNGAFTLLTLADNALLTNSAHGVIGRNATAKSNEVQLLSASARWLMGNNLFVGSNGAFNRMVVSNGAFLNNNSGLVGDGAASGNNFALVTGGGSVWTNRTDLTVGVSGRDNHMIISNGARVVSRIGNVGLNSGSSNNLVLVTGSGSVWTNHLDLNVGVNERFNRLVIEAGGQAGGDNGRVGAGFASDNSEAVVTGPGSLWSSRTDLAVGLNSGNNRLVVSNGAAVMAGNNGRVGAVTGATNNVVVVTGLGSLWGNQFELYVGEAGARNRMEVNSGGQVVSSNTYVGLFSASNLALVTGSGSLWSNRAGIFVGHSSSANQLVVSDGATAFSGGNAMIGFNNTAASNSITVTDPGSTWLAASNLYVGSNGAFNQLVIANGGRFAGRDAFVGSGFSSSNNLLLVTGAGSVWSNAIGESLFVGFNGGGNQLVVSNGGRADVSYGVLGENNISTRNEARVTGAGSLLNVGLFIVGQVGDRSRLVVNDGGALASDLAVIGQNVAARNNDLLVTDAGSIWTSDRIAVGARGDGNRLVLANGGEFRSPLTGGLIGQQGLVVGESSSSTNNRVVVDGGTLRVANTNGDSTLDVRRGTNVLNAGLIDVDVLLLTNTLGRFEFNGGTLVTRGASISNNAAFIVGANGSSPAIWDVRAGLSNHVMSGHLYVGLNSSFNQLFVTNGALLTNLFSFNVGAGGSSNSATISGPGSRGASDGAIEVSGGSFNRLVVGNGGSLIGRGTASIGALFPGAGNQIVVTGPESVWNQLGNVEFNGRGNQLLVTDGGLLVCSNASEGFFGSGSNLALVAGPGFVLNCLESLGVGSSGQGNQLQITNGARVTVGTSLLVGANTASTNNRVQVDESTLLVTNLTRTGVLEVRRGTNVFNAGLIETDILRVTNLASSRFIFNGGTLSARSSHIRLGLPMQIGNGVSPATFHLAGNGTHDMPSTLGLIVSSNATITGNGALIVQLQVHAGGTVRPGASIGKISLSTPPALAGTIDMELSKNGATLTNDLFQVTGTLTYSGTLTVTHLGPTALAVGDSFPLFNATAYAGAFTSLNLPPLAPPLFWKNNMLVNGSLEVAAPPAISLSAGPHTQHFDALATNGGANSWRDNVTLPGWYAARSVAPMNITTYRASDGSDNAGALYSFGSSASAERALGSIGSDTVGTISFGLGFTNDTGASVSNFVLSYTGEQWRDSSSFNTNTLTFWYRVSAAALTNPEPGVLTNWTAHTGLNFVSPTVTGAGLGIIGNAATNRRAFVSVPVPGLSVPPGHCVFFRWHDVNDVGADQALAVDDLTVSFVPLVRDFGLDVSHFQNESGVPQSSWDQMFVEGKRFVFIKATEGLTGPHDPTMATNVARATAAGLLAGVYHFAHPENRPTTNGAVLEASNMVVYAGSAIGPGRLRPVLDLERGSNLTTTELTDWVTAFSDEIILRRGPGAAPILYCTQTFANNELDSRLAGYDLWLRTIGTSANPAVDDPPAQGVFTSATGVFTNWSFWQYSSTGSSGGITPLDLNVCHSEYKPLSSFIIPDPTPTAIQLTGMTTSLGGTFEISFTNTPGARFTVLSATNVTLPASNWTIIGPVTEVSPGQFRFTDTNAPAFPTRFYRVLFP